MINRVEKSEFKGLMIYELSLRGIETDHDVQITGLTELLEKVLTEKSLFGIIMEVKNVDANPKVKFHSRKVSKKILNQKNHVGTVMLNTQVFTRIVVQEVREGIMFSDSNIMAKEMLYSKYEELKREVSPN